jgi:hypothetical protein
MQIRDRIKELRAIRAAGCSQVLIGRTHIRQNA